MRKRFFLLGLPLLLVSIAFAGNLVLQFTSSSNADQTALAANTLSGYSPESLSQPVISDDEAGIKNSSRNGGPVAYWPLDGDLLDASGNGYHATMVGSGLEFVTGISGQGVTGFLTESFFELPSLNLSYPASLSAWVYLENNSGFQKIFRSTICFGIYDGYWEPCGNLQIAPVSANDWHHFVIVDGDGLYVNGVKISDIQGAMIASFDNITNVGGPPYSEWLDGIIDEIRWYDYALSAEEVLELYNSMQDPEPTIPLSNWALLLGILLIITFIIVHLKRLA